MTRDEVIAAITHAARAVVHDKAMPGSLQTLYMALEAATAEGYGKAAREIADAIVSELDDAPSAPAAKKLIPVTVTVDWRLSKPPEQEPTWSSALDGKGKKALHSFHKAFNLPLDAYLATMEGDAATETLDKLITLRIEQLAKGEPAWLVYADVRLGHPNVNESAYMQATQAKKLPSALKSSYWIRKSGATNLGPTPGWWWTRIDRGTKHYPAGTPVYKTALI
jgi:hypothetical protein